MAVLFSGSTLWALPYEVGGEMRSMYPDFLVVRRAGGGHSRTALAGVAR